MPLTSVQGDRLPQYYPLRNRLVNGDMRIDQRNSGASLIIAVAGAYGVDRWITTPTGNSVSGQQIFTSAATPNPWSYVIGGNTSITAVSFAQRVEANNVSDMLNQTVTFSAKVSSSLLTTANWNAYYPNNSIDNWATSANNINFANGAWTINSTPTTYSAAFSCNASCVNGMQVAITVGALTSGNLVITDCQLENSSVPTSMERRPIATEFNMCQRYYQIMKSTAATVIYGIGNCTNATNMAVPIFFPTPMRAAPAFTFSNTNTFRILFGSTAVAVTATGAPSPVTVWQGVSAITTAGSLVANQFAHFEDNTGANSSIQISAEL
jgi:hypothetical protein